MSPLFPSAFWLGLVVAASLGLIISRVPFEIVGATALMAAIPPVLHMSLNRLGASDAADIWVVFAWIALALMLMSLTGGAQSPLAILLVFAPLHALTMGRFRLGIEASVFAAVIYLILAVLGSLQIPFPSPAAYKPVSGLFVLISVLQVGVFVAGTRNFLVVRKRRDRDIDHWMATLAETPIVILNLTSNRQIRSWLGDLKILDGLSPVELSRANLSSLFENASELYEHAGEAVALQPRWSETAALDGALVRASDGYRLVISAGSESDQSAASLRDQLEEAENDLKNQARWVASLGHELKNMLNPVSGYSDLILSERAGPLADPYKNFAGSIKQGSEHLRLLVEDLMTATKSKAGHLNLTIESLDVREEIESAIKVMVWQAEAHQVSVLLADGPDGHVEADQRALRQILMNLLSNAIKYSKSKGRVTVSAKIEAKTIEIDVRDQGEGLPQEELERLGEAFFQGENAKGRAGTGLGLSIVKLLTQTMDGDVRFESAPGEGTRVSFTLPRTKA